MFIFAPGVLRMAAQSHVARDFFSSWRLHFLLRLLAFRFFLMGPARPTVRTIKGTRLRSVSRETPVVRSVSRLLQKVIFGAPLSHDGR